MTYIDNDNCGVVVYILPYGSQPIKIPTNQYIHEWY